MPAGGCAASPCASSGRRDFGRRSAQIGACGTVGAFRERPSGGLLEPSRAFENEEIDIDELDDLLAAQLGSIKWTLDSRGRITIESKDDMRKRDMPSPDRADTVAMAFSRRANGGVGVNVEDHAGHSIR